MKKQYAKSEIQAEVFDAKAIANGRGASIRISINPGRKNKDGTWADKLWLNVIVWHKDLIQYALSLSKGDEIFIEGGRIEESKFTKDGVDRTSWQIVLPPFDCDIDRQLGTFGAKEVKRTTPIHAAEIPANYDDEVPF